MDDIPGLEWRDGELVIPSVRREIDDDDGWGVVTEVKVNKEKLAKVERLISYHEIKEATTLFELALWKARIDQVDLDDTETDINRDAYRVDVPGPVKDRVFRHVC